MRPTRAQVHKTMSRVRSSGSAIERLLGKALWKAGLRYRKQYRIIGRPDFVLVAHKIAIFCDSEFWHGYRWGVRAREAFKSNQDYWFKKIERNRARDKMVRKSLEAEGWKVVRFWERQIVRNAPACAEAVQRLVGQSARKPSY